MRSHTREREHILDFGDWYIGPARRRHRVIEGRAQGGGIVARIEGVDDRDAASGYAGSEICVHRTQLPALAPGEYYWDQLEGLAALDTKGARLGVVDHLFETGANDVMVIATGDGDLLVPFVPGVVTEVDLDQGVIRLDWQADV